MGPTAGAPLATLVGSADGWAALLPDGSYKLSGDPGGLWWVAGLSRFEPRELDNLPSSCPPCGGCPTMERTDAAEPTAVVADTVDLLTGILLAHPMDSPPRQLFDHFDIPIGAVLLGDGVRSPRAEGLIAAFDRVPPDRFPSFDNFAATVIHDPPSTTPAEPDGLRSLRSLFGALLEQTNPAASAIRTALVRRQVDADAVLGSYRAVSYTHLTLPTNREV